MPCPYQACGLSIPSNTNSSSNSSSSSSSSNTFNNNNNSSSSSSNNWQWLRPWDKCHRACRITHRRPLQLPGSFTAFPADGLPRYAIPNDPRSVLASGRHKKEIKRRTKTGCLTCRKRRIKCDEQHPVCKNCQKSKRDCMGYDPIFKQQQQQQHPTSIQPAPNSHPVPPSASVPSNGPPLPPPTAPPPVYNPIVMSATPGNTMSSNSMNKEGMLRTEGLDLNSTSALDPGLDMTTTSGSSVPAMHSMATNMEQRTMNSTTPHLRGGGPALVSMPQSASQPPSVPQQQQQQQQPQQNQPHVISLPSRTPKMPINQLVAMMGVSLPTPQAPPSAALLSDVRGLLTEIYGPGLERFFESGWFTKEQTIDMLMTERSTTDVLAAFLHTLSSVSANRPSLALDYPASLEPLVVWKTTLACFAEPSNQQMNAGRLLPPPDDMVEAHNRLTVFDALISGDVLSQNPLQPMLFEGDFHRLREFEFWFYLGEILTIGSDPSHPMPPKREEILGKMRTVLDRAREPRSHLDESMPRSKLAVARKFIQDEAKVTGGTTNVARCFSEIAARAFITRGGSRHTTT
ncbi:hypothetical protein PG987_007085 [Apiospora arundinis]